MLLTLCFSIEFPYLVFLMSGGHCQLAVVRGVDDFVLLGSQLDDSPGIAFDKVCIAVVLDLILGTIVQR